MSKKKHKFSKQIKAQIIQEMSQKAEVKNVPTTIKSVNSAMPQDNKTIREVDTAVLENLPLIKKDLLKTGITVACFVLAIAATFYFNKKYGILLTGGHKLFQILHIQ